MSSAFSEQILTDKLAKLNSTQQSIETLSHWCIFHRSNAELVVATWKKQFQSREMAQKVPLLYLANDILQNSKRQGNEFVSEFWKVLPGALKDIASKGDERGKGVVSRLVGIWEERRVFGSRSKSLRDVMLADEAPPSLDVSKKRLRGSKSAKRDSKVSRALSSGGMAEKIASAYHLVLSEHSNEDGEMKKCKSAIKHIRNMEKDVEDACSTAKDPRRKELAKELEEEENILKQCIEKLQSVEGSQVALVDRLRKALHEQESELENLQSQIRAAQEQAEEAQDMQKRLNDEDYVSKPITTASVVDNTTTTTNTTGDQAPKAMATSLAAMVADKLSSCASSHMIMQSVLSSLAAEATKTAGLSKPESSVPVSDTNAFGPPNPSYSNSTMLPQSTVQTQNHNQNQTPTSQVQYHAIPNPPTQQFLQPPGISPYSFGNIPLMTPAPPPPPPPHLMGGQVGSGNQPPPPPPPPPLQMPQPVTLPANPPQKSQQGPTFQPLQPPGMMYYGQPHHS
ncbi:PREDICTED: regulation of nuclear pre-mRNA domain-containing protein 1B-like isoform X2 [Tarenaya hassleriana]|uniref:regulation of nuclear pre-mRNA domain-containing protein 1B-like isoform X2 n=1 Tax=Tarenaya hassleriana TaxID=28532 RepID=UPI00053C4D28|nr:PREDICTED: regulation of nuclear pre-mRNA domain-containing protein 1B-like isoform X2 [Tarenaya hassleriana]